MSRGLPNLSEEIEEKLSINEDYDTQLHHYVEAILKDEKPWVSTKKLMSELDVTRPTVQKRLSELEGLGVVNSGPAGANGYIYWINEEKSDWPIPPDCEVTPIEDDEIKLSDITGRFDFGLAAAAVISALYASLAIGVPIASQISGIELAPMDILELMLISGFAAALLAILFGVSALILWIYGRARRRG